ncbi:endonuclease/exonuclease/phosphatase family protein [Streptomyces sp. Go40/10]|uniref:endonuclease/exonuclease/phosphatase family protein n=1 Tax=Streptomyces sp. Go40/10 TaxID=2825844 RepID=UPI001E3F8199|nr:endonuclease/exonuclease/phosphatase family protein [Streptomyces sp. Go40/10]UFR03604.1 endonuclease/exonuclease/phosphatase family protein [Streptomyces sp. Go40/10]
MTQRPGRRLGTWCAGLLLAGVSVVVGCRVADTDGITPVPQLLAFLPWLLAPAGLALLCALLTRWWTGLVWGVAVLGLLAWYVEPYGTIGEPDGPQLARLRVLTANVESGRGTPALVPVIRDRHPDVVFVQECGSRCRAVLEGDFATDYPHRRAVEENGSKGSLILSRHPLAPAPGVPGTMGMPGAVADVGGASRASSAEPGEGHAVRLQLAHPMPPLPGQVALWRRELARLRAFAATRARTPTILAGDFNASQDHAAFRHILDTGLTDAARLAGHDRTPSWPSRTASVIGAQIDHVLVSGDFTATGAHFLRVAGSDHRALIVDLTLHGRT